MMQMNPQTYLGRRAAYYGARMTVDSLQRGDHYDQVADSKVLFFLAKTQFDHRPEAFHVCYALRQVDSGVEAMPELAGQTQLHFFEIPKAVAKLRAGRFDDNDSAIGSWLSFFNSPTDPLTQETYMTNPALKAAMDSLETVSADKKAQEIARLREKAQHHWASEINGARKEGMAEGEAKGRAEGQAEGRAATTQTTLRAMLSSPATRDLPDEVIAGILGVDVALVASARQEVQGSR